LASESGTTLHVIAPEESHELQQQIDSLKLIISQN
jgi:hypothetical protein